MTSINLKKHEISKVCKEATHKMLHRDQIRSVQLSVHYQCPRSLGSLWNFVLKLTMRKLESCGYPTAKTP